MLVHHTDSLVDGINGIMDGYGGAVKDDFPFVRFFQTEQHLHQGGLTRAVFPCQRMDFPLSEGEIHMIVGHKSGRVNLCDIPHFQNIRIIHVSTFS